VRHTRVGISTKEVENINAVQAAREALIRERLQRLDLASQPEASWLPASSCLSPIIDLHDMTLVRHTKVGIENKAHECSPGRARGAHPREASEARPGLSARGELVTVSTRDDYRASERSTA
jgi:hypothetical protein